MKTVRAFITTITRATVALAAVAFLQPTVHAAEASAKLKGAKITFDTPKGDDKDDNTKITVTLYTKENNEWKRIVAHKKDFAGDTTYEDPSNHAVELDIQGDITRAQVDGLRVVIEIQPDGNDTWIFNYKVQLNFDDDTTLEKGTDGIKLKEDDRKHEKTY